METRLTALKDARCIKWHELAEELGITRQMLGAVKAGRRSFSKKVERKLCELEEETKETKKRNEEFAARINSITPEERQAHDEKQAKQLEEYQNRQSNPAFVNHMTQTTVLAPEEICAQQAMNAYRSAKKLNNHLQFESLMMWIREAMKDPVDGPTQNAIDILKRMQNRDYPQNNNTTGE